MMPARLTSDLLARKGEARPSSFGGAFPANSAAARSAGAALIGPATQRAPLVEILVPAEAPRLAVAGSDRSRPDDQVNLSVRIDRALHTRLRVLAARQVRTNQDIVQGALEAYINVFAPDCGCIGRGRPKS